MDFEVVYWHIFGIPSTVRIRELVSRLVVELDGLVAVAASRWRMIAVQTVPAARCLCAVFAHMFSAPAEVAKFRPGNNGDFRVFGPSLVVDTERGWGKLV